VIIEALLELAGPIRRVAEHLGVISVIGVVVRGEEVADEIISVPVSKAAWSTWRRYCNAAGLSMGQGIAALIAHELRTAADEGLGEDAVLLARMKRRQAEIEDSLAAKLTALAGREAAVAAREGRVRAREFRLDDVERRIRSSPAPTVQPRVGRNDSCPCGSGAKYKRCHGSGPHAGR